MGKKSVLIHVRWDDSKVPIKQCSRIKDNIDKIDGITESFITENSDISNIAALAEWDENEIAEKISTIEHISNVKSVTFRILVPA